MIKEKAKIIILGSQGNLGQEILKVFADLNPVAWDRSELDITQEASVLAKISDEKPDIIVNCAAYNDVDMVEDEGRLVAESINGYAPGYIAAAAASISSVFVHYSTGQVFDGNKAEGYNEDALPNPVNAYGRTKLMGEIESQKKTDKLYVIRTEWLYGKGSRSETSKKSFVDVMLEMAEKDQTINAVVDEFGKPTYVKDLAQATRAMLEEAKPFGIYHLTNSGMASRYDWAKEIFKIKGINAKLAEVEGSFFGNRKAKRPKYEVLNNTKFIELRPWTEALKDYLETI